MAKSLIEEGRPKTMGVRLGLIEGTRESGGDPGSIPGGSSEVK